MAHYSVQNRRHHIDEDEFDDEDDSYASYGSNFHMQAAAGSNQQAASVNYDHQHQATTFVSGGAARQPAETIQVTLNESYFASERRILLDLFANLRQKLSSTQMFNPAKNETIKQQQQEWNEKEKYTLDSLNEIKSTLDGRFQWSRPEDGREVWPSKLQYFLAITSYSIGLGNVIRFPILVQKNGGLAFILPFVIMLLLEGIPLLYLELAIGQRMRKAAISCWNLVSPFAAGIGLASAAVSFVIGLYYNTMVAWTLLYLWASVAHRPLPFTQCPDGETTPGESAPAASNSSSETSTEADECQIAGPFEYYWYRKTLDIAPDVDSWSNFNWPVMFCLVSAWLISYACLLRGLSSSKRVVFVASLFPYVILLVFFFKAISLKGMGDGIYYLFAPEWAKLVDPYVWLQAAAQVFFSLGLGFGGLIALSSYNPVNNNCYKDAIRVSLVNFLTSMFAGVVIFAILGYKANLSNDKCMMEREQQIEFYLADYNLKVLDYGAIFKQVPLGASPVVSESTLPPSEVRVPLHVSGDIVRRDQSEGPGRKMNEFVVAQSEKNASLAGRETKGGSPLTERDYYYDYNSEDAIDSINNLDRQLDLGASSGSFDYGDSDTEFIINVSNLIGPEELNRIIENIPNLLECSVKKELDAATQGAGLVFVVMAEALSQFGEHDSTWAIVFFLMILALGFDSQFGNLEGLLSSVMDLNPANSATNRQFITGLICAMSLIISVIFFAHGAGSYMFAIFDEYAGSFSLVLIALFELLTISYVYGLKRFCDDCELMTGKRPHFVVLLSWRFVSPILLLIVILATTRQLSTELNYDAWAGGHLVSRTWPNWCVLLGSLLIVSCIAWIPLVAVLRILRIHLIPEEQLSQCWFPAEELREYHELQDEHRVTRLERILFGFNDED